MVKILQIVKKANVFYSYFESVFTNEPEVFLGGISMN